MFEYKEIKADYSAELTFVENSTTLLFDLQKQQQHQSENYTVNSNYTTSETTVIDFIISFSYFAYIYYTPVITFTGAIGNLFSVLVFFRTKLKKLSSSYYLSALCISDTGFLIINFVSWLYIIDIDIYNYNIFCQLFTFLSSFCSALSVWFVVSFTIERFIAVDIPLKRQTMCTIKRAKSILIGLIAVSAIHNLPLLVLSSPVKDSSNSTVVCGIRHGYEVNFHSIKSIYFF